MELVTHFVKQMRNAPFNGKKQECMNTFLIDGSFCCSDTKGYKYIEVWYPYCGTVQSQSPNGGGVSALSDHHIRPHVGLGAALRGSDPLGMSTGAFAGSQHERLILQTGMLRPVEGRPA